MTNITRILSAIDDGDAEAAAELLPLVYAELRTLASQKFAREKPGQTLQPTVLVHEAYLRLVDVETPQRWNSRGHFFSAAAEAMRRILVENARRKRTQKLGGQLQKNSLDAAEIRIDGPNIDMLALDEVLSEFEKQWPEKAQLVKLRYFTGMTISEASETMGIAHATAERYWKFARTWLYSRLQTDDSEIFEKKIQEP
jgi:RNA polymerase sigma factor (TIGR02999 family)